MHVPLIDVAFTCHCEVFPKVWLDFGVSKVPLKGQKARISPRRRHGRAARGTVTRHGCRLTPRTHPTRTGRDTALPLSSLVASPAPAVCARLERKNESDSRHTRTRARVPYTHRAPQDTAPSMRPSTVTTRIPHTELKSWNLELDTH